MIRDFISKKLKSRKVTFITCTIAAAVALFSISFNIGERLYVKNNTITDKSVFGISQENPASINSELIIYDNLQNMASEVMDKKVKNETNIDISKEKIQSLRVIVTKMGYSDRGYILSVLDRWEKGNFSLITDEHNYFYLRLKDYLKN
jgi:hypothetical protein